MTSILEKLYNTAKDFIDEKKWGINADNAILTLQQLEEAHPKIVQDPNHPTWNDPLVTKNSEYDAKTNTIHIRPGYDIENDPTYNVIHEKCHAYLTQIAKLNTKTLMSLQPYPTQALEQVAYTTEFYYWIKDGHSLEELKATEEFSYFFKKYGDVLTKYYDYAQKKYNEEQAQIALSKVNSNNR